MPARLIAELGKNEEIHDSFASKDWYDTNGCIAEVLIANRSGIVARVRCGEPANRIDSGIMPICLQSMRLVPHPSQRNCEMFSRGIKIQWDGATEYLPLDVQHMENFGLSHTVEIWSRSKETVKYNVSASIGRSGKKYVVEVHYHSSSNEPRLAKLARWGTSTIEIVPGRNSGKAIWTDDSDKRFNGTSLWSQLPRGIVATPKRRRRNSIEREQAIFRSTLLALDPRCALTGERSMAALEAAHVVPARNGGREVVENGILLRADLHRLWDAGLFSILPNGTVLGVGDISDSYKKILTGARLHESACFRVSDALNERQKLGFNNRDTDA